MIYRARAGTDQAGRALVALARAAVAEPGRPVLAGSRIGPAAAIGRNRHEASIPGQIIELRFPRRGGHRGGNRNLRVRPSHQGIGDCRSANPASMRAGWWLRRLALDSGEQHGGAVVVTDLAGAP
jgi:hypothetical protein